MPPEVIEVLIEEIVRPGEELDDMELDKVINVELLDDRTTDILVDAEVAKIDSVDVAGDDDVDVT